MDAKVMKDFVKETKSGLTAEYYAQQVDNSNRVTFSFSQAPRFVCLSILRLTRNSNYIYTVNIPTVSEDTYVYYYAASTSSTSIFARWSGNQLQLSSVDGSYAYAIAFF